MAIRQTLQVTSRAVRHGDDVVTVLGPQEGQRRSWVRNSAPQPVGLQEGALAEFLAAETFRGKPEVVLNPRAGTSLDRRAPRPGTTSGSKPLGCPMADPCRKAGRPGPNDHYIVKLLLSLSTKSNLVGQLCRPRLHQSGSIAGSTPLGSFVSSIPFSFNNSSAFGIRFG